MIRVIRDTGVVRSKSRRQKLPDRKLHRGRTSSTLNGVLVKGFNLSYHKGKHIM